MKGSNFRQFAGEGLGQGAGRLGRSGWLRLGLLAALLILVLGGGGGPEPGPIELDRLSTWPGYGRGPAADVAVANGTAFVAVEQGGLLVVDVTSPSHPVGL